MQCKTLSYLVLGYACTIHCQASYAHWCNRIKTVNEDANYHFHDWNWCLFQRRNFKPGSGHMVETMAKEFIGQRVTVQCCFVKCSYYQTAFYKFTFISIDLSAFNLSQRSFLLQWVVVVSEMVKILRQLMLKWIFIESSQFGAQETMWQLGNSWVSMKYSPLGMRKLLY